MKKEAYEEERTSPLLMGILAISTAMIAVMAFVFLSRADIESGAGFFLAGLFVIFALLTYNFRAVRIRIDSKGVRAGYGVFSSYRPWSAIRSVEEDEKHYFYGYGVRLGRYKGRWVLVYNTIGDARVVFITKTGMCVMASTGNPKELLAAARRFRALRKNVVASNR